MVRSLVHDGGGFVNYTSGSTGVVNGWGVSTRRVSRSRSRWGSAGRNASSGGVGDWGGSSGGGCRRSVG